MVASHRDPYLSARAPAYGAAKVGKTKAKKISPAPVEVQPNLVSQKIGRVESKAVRKRDCANIPQRALSIRGHARRVMIDGSWDLVPVACNLASQVEEVQLQMSIGRRLDCGTRLDPKKCSFHGHNQ